MVAQASSAGDFLSQLRVLQNVGMLTGNEVQDLIEKAGIITQQVEPSWAKTISCILQAAG